MNLEHYIPNEWTIEHDEATFPEKGYRGLNWRGRIRFKSILVSHDLKLRKFLASARSKKACYVGPFYGEFGNFLLHFLPFISYLHHEGIKCNICVLDRYLPFLKADTGEVIYDRIRILNGGSLTGLPPASANILQVIPDDFGQTIVSFFDEAKSRDLPLLDLGDSNLYWYSFRNWQLKGLQHFYYLTPRQEKKNKVILFPRKKGARYTSNNGETLNYGQLAEILTRYFEEVVIVGIPEMSDSKDVSSNPKIKIRIGSNEDVIRECGSAALIVSQHSGAIHTGIYTKTPALLIFKGILPVKGLDDTLRFRANAAGCPVYLVTQFEQLPSFFNAFLSGNATLTYQ